MNLDPTADIGGLSCRQVCWTTGEALGSLCGGTVFLLLSSRGLGRLYWLGFGTIAIVLTVLLLVSHRPAGPVTAQGTGYHRGQRRTNREDR